MAMGGGTACMHHPLGNALVVEMGDLLAQVEILQQGGPAFANLERMVRVGQPHPLGRREKIPALCDGRGFVLRGLSG